MFDKNNEGFKLPEKKIKYMQHGEEIEQFIGDEGLEWWNEFAEKWDHTEIVEVSDVVYTEEQLERFEEVKDLDVSLEVLETYALEGTLGEGLENLKKKEQDNELVKMIATLTMENAKKDMQLSQLAKTVAELTMKVEVGK